MSVIHGDFRGRRSEHQADLPPGQTEVIQWPVLTYGPTPRLKPEEWSMVIDGEVQSPMALDWQMFNALPKTKMTVNIHCVTRWSRFDMPWEGVLVDELISQVGGLTNTAKYVIASCDGDYTTNLPIADVMNGKAMVAIAAHDQPLSPEHGGPARLLVPHLYFWKSAKWLRGLTFVADDQPGFWEQNGYHNYGDPWREQRYDSDT
jgi:DMSO/TMAO reductase YedYZ molybdopterin-dependent catalytic subunit